MSDKKFTDDEVIKALECCFVHSNCTNCPLASPPKTDCLKRAGIRAVAVFNRQKAEIERLRKYYFTHDYHECHNEAIEEFAERLHERLYSVPTVYNSYFGKMIDHLVKEMTEGGEPRKEDEKNG